MARKNTVARRASAAGAELSMAVSGGLLSAPPPLPPAANSRIWAAAAGDLRGDGARRGSTQTRPADVTERRRAPAWGEFGRPLAAGRRVGSLASGVGAAAGRRRPGCHAAL